MGWLAVFRPRRSLTLPFLVVAAPALYFVYRDAAMGCRAARPCLDATHAGYGVAGVVGAYFVACGTLALVDAAALADANPYARLALRPTDRTLGVLAAFAAALGVYLLATLAVTVPAWLDRVLAPFGLVLALPFAVGYGLLVVVTDAVLSKPPMWFRTAAVAVSVALTGMWLFALATGVAGLLGPWLSARAKLR